jgi:hypothetical protein
MAFRKHFSVAGAQSRRVGASEAVGKAFTFDLRVIGSHRGF